MHCKDSRRLWIIPTSPHVMLPRPWRSPACRPRSCVGERRSMHRPRPGIEVPFRRLTTTDDRSGSRWFSFDRCCFFGSGCSLSVCTIPDTRNGCRKSGSRLTEIGCPTQVCVCVCTVDKEGAGPSSFRLSLSAQSEEARKRKQVATLDERLETLSQKLSRELTTTRWHIPRVAPPAIQRMGLSNGFTSRISNTANLAAWAIQRLPI
jgi:hypothetical protein